MQGRVPAVDPCRSGTDPDPRSGSNDPGSWDAAPTREPGYYAVIHLYRGDPSKGLIDPAVAVRAALAKALVHYYPLAGRLREEADRKLVVDCAGQGVMFVEADADIAIDDLGDVRYPPFPRSEEFIYDDHVYRAPPPGVPLVLAAIINQPLLYVQVTRLKCGGFTVCHQSAHCISDAAGLAQFWNAVGELARGASAPSVQPVWDREIFNARQPPLPTFPHDEYREPADGCDGDPPRDMARVQFSFGPGAIAALRSRVARGAASASQFDLVAACVWRSRTAALGYAPGQEVRLMMAVNARGQRMDVFGREIPAGYYGNAFAFTVARCAAGELCGRDLGYAVGLIKAAKARVTYEYMRSVADMMVLEGRPVIARKRTFGVSDLSHAGFDEAEFGWGKPVYSGVTTDSHGDFRGGATFFIRGKNEGGEDETFVGIYLPQDCTARYRMEVLALTVTTTTTKLRPLMDKASSAPLAPRARY